MLYQPSFPSPYLSNIDANKENIFSCYINAEGGTQVVGYSYTIKDLNDNELLSNTHSFSVASEYLYGNQILEIKVPITSGMKNGNDYIWNIKLIEENPDMWVTNGTIQSGSNTTTNVYLRKSYLIKAGQYLKTLNNTIEITDYDKATGLATLKSALPSVPSDGTGYTIYTNTVTSNDFYFCAKTTPTLQLKPFPSTISSKSYKFEAIYEQAEGLNWKYFQWFLYDDIGTEVSKSEKIKAGEIEYKFDGFFKGKKYGINVVVETQDGEEISTDIEYFNIKYSSSTLNNIAKSTILPNNSIKVEWEDLTINEGVLYNNNDVSTMIDYVFNEPYNGSYSVEIKDTNKSNIYWYLGSKFNPKGLTYNSTTYLNWHTDKFGFVGDVFKQEGEYIQLLSLSSAPPSECKAGDIYYNTKNKLLYSAVMDNVWNTFGEQPVENEIYFYYGNKYEYNIENDTLDVTTSSLPIYSISYKDGDFIYNIKNTDVDISETIHMLDIYDDWLLKSNENTDIDNQLYKWDDSKLWDDELFWTEQSIDLTNNYWFKITLLPTEVKITKLNKQ